MDEKPEDVIRELLNCDGVGSYLHEEGLCGCGALDALVADRDRWYRNCLLARREQGGPMKFGKTAEQWWEEAVTWREKYEYDLLPLLERSKATFPEEADLGELKYIEVIDEKSRGAAINEKAARAFNLKRQGRDEEAAAVWRS